MRLIDFLLFSLVSLSLFFQSATAAANTSLTVDEGLHITSGYTILRTGDFRLIEEHPPLVKVWEALPLLPLHDLPDPHTLPGWESDIAVTDSVRLVRAAQALVYSYRPVDRLVVPARVQSALLAVLLGAVVFRWARDLWGGQSGLLALFLLTFDPNILAHASVAGTDLGTACFIALALFTLSRYLRRPTAGRLLFLGISLGLAQGAKLSAALLLPVTVFALLLELRQRRLLRSAAVFLIAGVMLWAVYGFDVGHVPGLLFPIPAAAHAIPWMRLRQHMADGHAAFLLGENRTHGWWYYFPVAFALKTPPPTLMLVALGAIHRARQAFKIHRALPLIFALFYSVSSLLSPLNIGYRHLLPILPPLFVIASRVFSPLKKTEARQASLLPKILFPVSYLLLLWLAISTLHLWPHYLAYFNELAGGPDNGWRYLADSNTDWGQAYKDLARFQREHNVGQVRLSAFVFYDPAIYGVEYEPLTPMRGNTPAVFPSRFSPPPGEYIISATPLDGIPLADPEMYDWFRKREPEARIGHVLFYYHVPLPEREPSWVAQCTIPSPPLSFPDIAEGFGRDDLRLLYFDCTRSWLYPEGGETPGWYIFHRDVLASEMGFIRERLAPARLSFEQRMPHDIPPLAVYEWNGDALPSPEGTEVWAAPASWLPEQALSGGVRLTSPVPFDGPLEFLGYETKVEKQALILLTWWRVTAQPDRPFSLMGHLIAADGAAMAVADGMGAVWDQLQSGDIIVQRHIFERMTGAENHRFRTGVYWLDTIERWKTRDTGDDCLLLGK